MITISAARDDGLLLRIEDNGRGFDVDGVRSVGHQGLANMRSRIATVGATMDLESDPRGTRIEIHRPTDRTDSDEESTTR